MKQRLFESIFNVDFGKLGRYCGKLLIFELYKISSAILNLSNTFLFKLDLTPMFLLILENDTFALKIHPCVSPNSGINTDYCLKFLHILALKPQVQKMCATTCVYINTIHD